MTNKAAAVPQPRAAVGPMPSQQGKPKQSAPNQCRVCQGAFPSRELFQEHLKTSGHARPKPTATPTADKPVAGASKSAPPKKSSKAKNAKDGKTNGNDNSTASANKGNKAKPKKSLKCAVCTNEFTNKHALNQHMASLGHYRCTDCSKDFATPAAAMQHFKAVHAATKDSGDNDSDEDEEEEEEEEEVEAAAAQVHVLSISGSAMPPAPMAVPVDEVLAKAVPVQEPNRGVMAGLAVATALGCALAGAFMLNKNAEDDEANDKKKRNR